MITIEVDFDYTPPEAPTCDSPGEAEAVRIHAVRAPGATPELEQAIMDAIDIERVEQAVLKAVKGGQDDAEADRVFINKLWGLMQ